MKTLVFFSLLASGLAAPTDESTDRRDHGKIAGGGDANVGDVPYILSLQHASNETYHICAASIYSETIAVTAAHCVTGYEVKNLQVVAGEHKLFQDDGQTQTVKISKVTIHPEYNVFSLSSDVAVLQLSSSLTFNDYVKAIPLPPQNHTVDGNCDVSGWGSLSEGGSFPAVLQKATIPVVPREQCSSIYGEEFYETMICAGDAKHGACAGDSGGPLACSDTGSSYLAGIVSWGYGCARPGYPDIYTNVPVFVDWIEESAVGTFLH